MLTAQFEELFEYLVCAWARYQEASRRVDDVGELARRRFDLETARSAIARERTVIEATQIEPADHQWLSEIGVCFSSDTFM